VKIVLSGGGTAGHINPAISIAKKILEQDKNAQILFVGTPRGMENALVAKEGFPIRHVDVMGFRRKLTAENLKVAYLALKSVGEAKKILKEFRPDVVVGTGGYVSWPVLRAASKMGIPTLIHEQNAVPGLTTRKLSKTVDVVCTSFAESEALLPCDKKKICLTGNPVDPSVGKLSRAACRTRLGISAPFVLSYGGSLGARAINEAAFAMAKDYACHSPIFHTHAFGVRNYPEFEERERTERICRFGNVRFLDYIFDMPVQMCAADLVVCRAGAITLAELAVMKKPAILIPSPNVTDNHQYKNALVFKEKGAALLLEEKDLTPEGLTAAVKSLLSDPAALRTMSENMAKLALPHALDEICKNVWTLAKRNK